MPAKLPTISVIDVYNNARIVDLPRGPILLYSPPETLKHLLAKGLPVPDTVLLPPDIPPGVELGSSGFVRKGINYASFEFILYYNFFVAGGKKTRIVTITEHQAERIRRVVHEVIAGPFHLFPSGGYDWLQRECEYVTYSRLLGRSPLPEDLAEVVSLELDGSGFLEDVQLDFVDDSFVFSSEGSVVLRVNSATPQPAAPWLLFPPRPLLRQELTLQFVGSGDGFDPNEITTCFIAYFTHENRTTTLLVDAAAYLQIRLGNLGISLGQIHDVVITHVHEDHIAGLPELLLMGQNRLRIITSDLVFFSLRRLLSAVLNVSEEDVSALFDYAPANPNQPFSLDGLQFSAMYAVHSIPTIAIRVNGLYYSGDMIYNEEWFKKLEAEAIITSERRSQLVNFANDAVVLVQDVGGGTIHTTLTTEVFQALASKGQHLILAHTGKRNLPAGSDPAHSSVQFASSGLVKAIGEVIHDTEYSQRLETLSSCPLYARLPVEQRIDLARRVSMVHLKPGEGLMQLGDLFDGRVFVVHAGLLEIWVDEKLLMVIGRGTSIGERGALYGDARTGTIVARSDATLLALDQSLFEPVSTYLGLREAFARAEWLWRKPSFGHFSWATLLDLALDFEPRIIGPGEYLYRAGDPGGYSYLLVSGILSLTNKQGEPLATFNDSGEFFGGRTALEGRIHGTSVEALSRSEVWALPIAGLQRLQMVYPNVLLYLKAVDVG